MDGSAAGRGVSGPSAAYIGRSWRVGVSPRSGRRSPIRVLPGAQPANTQPKPQPAVVAGCAPGRFLIASGARPRRDPNPAPTTPKPPAERTRSLSEGGPAGGALDLDFHRPDTRPQGADKTPTTTPRRASRTPKAVRP